MGVHLGGVAVFLLFSLRLKLGLVGYYGKLLVLDRLQVASVQCSKFFIGWFMTSFQ